MRRILNGFENAFSSTMQYMDCELCFIHQSDCVSSRWKCLFMEHVKFKHLCFQLDICQVHGYSLTEGGCGLESCQARTY